MRSSASSACVILRARAAPRLRGGRSLVAAGLLRVTALCAVAALARSSVVRAASVVAAVVVLAALPSGTVAALAARANCASRRALCLLPSKRATTLERPPPPSLILYKQPLLRTGAPKRKDERCVRQRLRRA